MWTLEDGVGAIIFPPFQVLREHSVGFGGVTMGHDWGGGGRRRRDEEEW